MHGLFHISTSISTEYFISVRAIASTDMNVRSADASTDMEQAVHYYFYHVFIVLPGTHPRVGWGLPDLI